MAPKNQHSVSPEVFEAAKHLWYSLPERKRSARGVTDTLKKRGFNISKSSVTRWSKEWTPDKAPTAETTRKLLPSPPQQAPPTLDDVPADLREALSPRLLHLASGAGLERVENAIILLADAIGGKATEIAEQLLAAEVETEETTGSETGETTTKRTEKAQVARSAVGAIATLASSMQAIAASKSLIAMSHRNFGEGDFYIAQAEKERAQARIFHAEAEAALGAARADNAKEIDAVYSHVAPDDAKSALDALHGTRRPKPAKK